MKKTNSMTYEIARCYVRDLGDVDPAIVKKLGGYLRAKDLAALTSCTQHFDTAKHGISEWRALRQMEAFFKKNASFAKPSVCRSQALLSFMEAEDQCSQTNLRLQVYMDRLDLLDEVTLKLVCRMERYISNVLGDYHLFLNQLADLVKVTPGATANAKREDSLPQLKMRLKLFATSRAARYLKSIYHLRGFENLRVRPTVSNRVEFVPKNWKTDRTIACEPEGNIPLQLAFDSYAKRRLRRFGIDLSDQSKNQRLAREASMTNELVTVDFKSASDTISYNVVSWLFPEGFVKFLTDVRSPGWRLGKKSGVQHVYSKFSSMGNGTTFCIETLIFAAACYAVGSKRFSVYGDDVIIEKDLFEAFTQLTRFLGFNINVEKTFCEGPFRESCGGDFYAGIDVTPKYLRGEYHSKAMLCHVVNSMAHIAVPGGHLWDYLIGIVAEKRLPLVPFSLSTTAGIHICPTVARKIGSLWTTCCRDRYRSYVPSYLEDKKTKKYLKRDFGDSRGYYLWFLTRNHQVTPQRPWFSSIKEDVGIDTLDIHLDLDSPETSSALTYIHKYVRRKVSWFAPAQATPVHLYWWTEDVVRSRRRNP